MNPNSIVSFFSKRNMVAENRRFSDKRIAKGRIFSDFYYY